MIGRRAIAGLSLLSALLFCALAAQGASAAAHTSKNTTAVTCVKGGGKLDFKDAHCDETTIAGKGVYGHEPLSGNPTTLEVTNEKTKNATTEHTPAVLKGELLKAKLEITCTKVKSTTEVGSKKSVIENGGTGTEHIVTGTVIVDFEECKVLLPEKCNVKEPIEVKSQFKGVDELNADKLGMGVEFVPDNEAGIFVEITLEGAECGLKGTTFQVKGSIIGTGTPGDNAKESGATTIFKEKNAEDQKLTIGGKPAEFIGAFTSRMHTGTGTGEAIALTTTT